MNYLNKIYSICRNQLLHLFLILLIPLVSIGYKILNNPSRGVHTLVTDLDKSIPFIKAFIVPYLGWELFLVLGLGYLAIKDKPVYYRTLTAIIISMLISYGVYYFYQTTVPRPYLEGNDILTRLVALTYFLDKPYNCFPSIHSLTSFILIRAYMHSTAKTAFNQIVVGVCAILIILSTLFVKQHVILDLLSAIILGEVVIKQMLSFNLDKYLLSVRKLLIFREKEIITRSNASRT